MSFNDVKRLVYSSLAADHKNGTFGYEMGEPVRILDLAKLMLKMKYGESYLQRIKITNLKSGEKLNEDLFTEGEFKIPICDKVFSIQQSAIDQFALEKIKRMSQFLETEIEEQEFSNMLDQQPMNVH